MSFFANLCGCSQVNTTDLRQEQQQRASIRKRGPEDKTSHSANKARRGHHHHRIVSNITEMPSGDGIRQSTVSHHVSSAKDEVPINVEKGRESSA